MKLVPLLLILVLACGLPVKVDKLEGDTDVNAPHNSDGCPKTTFYKEELESGIFVCVSDPVGDEPGEVYLPFITDEMRSLCDIYGGGEVCFDESDPYWERDFGISLRGSDICPYGAYLDENSECID